MISEQSSSEGLKIARRPPYPVRHKVVYTYATNRFFQHQLLLMLDEARTNNSNTKFSLRKALTSIQKFPLHIPTPQAGKDLDGWGDWIIAKLDKALKDAKETFGGELTLEYIKILENSRKTENKRKRRSSRDKQQDEEKVVDAQIECEKKEEQKEKIYNNDKIKSYFDAVFDDESDSEKERTVKKNKKENFNRQKINKPSSFGINPIVPQRSHRIDQTATEIGLHFRPYRQIHTCTNRFERQESLEKRGHEQVMLDAGSYRVILLIDQRETNGLKDVAAQLSKKLQPDELRICTLPLGDYAWIAEKINGNENDPKLMLNALVERKRRDDLLQSIKDKTNRYYDQKIRMIESGIEHIFLLIEKEPRTAIFGGIPESTLKQAAANTQIHDNFHVVHTSGPADTATYLVAMTRRFQSLSKQVVLLHSNPMLIQDLRQNLPRDEMEACLSFEDYKKIGTKHRPVTLKELHMRLLMSFRGMSSEKAQNFVQQYSTFAATCKAFENSDENLDSNTVITKNVKVLIERFFNHTK